MGSQQKKKKPTNHSSKPKNKKKVEEKEVKNVEYEPTRDYTVRSSNDTYNCKSFSYTLYTSGGGSSVFGSNDSIGNYFNSKKSKSN